MTEAEWLASEDPGAMLAHVAPPAYESAPYSSRRGADGRWEVTRHFTLPPQLVSDRKLRLFATACARVAGHDEVEFGECDEDRPLGRFTAATVARNWCIFPTFAPARADLLRDVVGNPWRPVAFSLYAPPVWNAADSLRLAIMELAASAYHERGAGGMLGLSTLGILADALEDAGCTNAGILAHMRSPGPHVRGCWALDLILGKE